MGTEEEGDSAVGAEVEAGGKGRREGDVGAGVELYDADPGHIRAACLSEGAAQSGRLRAGSK